MINDARRDEIFEQMNGYVLALDPQAIGPRYFIDKIAICRNYLNSVSLVLSELQRDKLMTSSELHKLQAIIELEGAKLLATDEVVKRLANIKDRESMVAHILNEKHRRVNQLKDQLQTIDGLLKHVSLRNRELHATMDAIKNQRRFMHIEVQTGAFYGDERLPDHERSVGMGNGGTSGDFGEAEIRKMIEDSSKDEAVAEITAALDEAASLGGSQHVRLLPAAMDVPAINLDPEPEPVPAPNPAPASDSLTSLLDAVPDPVAAGPDPIPEPAGVVPPPPPALSVEDAQAMSVFLGDSQAQPSTVEPSKSVPQEAEDFSFLLDSV